MAKIYGLFGSMQGKVADVVMAVRNGEQIVRKYQPIVSNPNTAAQVKNRAKLKLISQLSAVMGPYIAIPRKGTASPRNQFFKKNYGLATYATETASVDLNNIKLTDSVVGLPSLRVTEAEGVRTVRIQNSRGVDFDRVVYAFFKKEADESLRAIGSAVVSDGGQNNNFPTEVPIQAATDVMVIYAYGVRINSQAARVTFGNMTAPTAQDVAKLIVTRSLTESDITLTETQGVTSVPSSQMAAPYLDRSEDDDVEVVRKKKVK